MSYDVTLTAVVPTVVHDANYTSNMAPMWRAAGVDLAAYNGKTAAQLADDLGAAVARIKADPALWTQYDADNGWGDSVTALAFLGGILDACRLHPEAVVEVSR